MLGADFDQALITWDKTPCAPKIKDILSYYKISID
jgi:hypothetical protein